MVRALINRLRYTERGFLLLSLMVTTVMITLLMVATVQTVSQSYDVSTQDTYKLQAQIAADSGADYGIEQILADAGWTGTPSKMTLSSGSESKSTYEVSVTTAADGQTKTMNVTGRIYVPADATTAKSSSKLEVGLKGNGASGVDGGVSAYIGVGGLVMSGSAAITDGIVYSNGPISMSGNPRIGSSGNPVDVYVANMVCPIGGGSGYPRLCTNGENNNPITAPSWATFIYGTVRANWQINTSGMANPGLVSGAVAASDLPNDNRAGRINTILSSGQTQTGAVAGCSGMTNKTWPANLKITGNVTISGSCNVTIMGDVWITGNLTVSGDTKLIVQSGLTTPPHLMVDGSTGFQLSSGALVPNSSNTGFRIITYYSTNSCSVSTAGCTITGTDLYNSKSKVTISISGGTQSPKTQFYARWSAVQLAGSAGIGALIGQTVELSGDARVNSGVEIDPTQPGAITWTVNSYKRTY